MGAFSMGESGKVEAWAGRQVEAIEEIETECTLNLTRQRPVSSAMVKVIWPMFAQVNLQVKLSRHATVFVPCLKNSPRLTSGYLVMNGITTPEECALTDVSFNKFLPDSKRKSSGLTTKWQPERHHDPLP